MPKYRKKIIELNKTEVLNKLKNPPEDGDWILAIEPDTWKVRIVNRRSDGYVPDVEGYEDLFPLFMAIERDDGYIEGGDWLVASTPGKQKHDGLYRSYWIKWID